MAGSDDDFKKKLLATFREEAEEYLSVITEGLITLERQGSPASAPELTEQVYRKIHSLKGAARAVNAKEIELICQNTETVFSAMKRGEYIPDADAYDMLHTAVRTIRELLAGKRNEDSSSAEIIVSLRGLISGRQTGSIGQPSMGGDTPGEGTADLAVPLVRVAEGEQYSGESSPDTSHRDSNRRKTTPDRKIPPDNGGPLPVSGPIRAFPASNSGTVRIAAQKLDRLIAGADDLLTTRLFIAHRVRELEEMMTRFTLWQWNQTLVANDMHRIREITSGTQAAPLPRELVHPLQRMMEFLEYDREFITRLRHDLAAHVRATELDRSALESGTSEISDLIHDAVLIPFSSILMPVAEFVREFSRSSGKPVDLRIEGERIEMDRRILEALRDPLMHLIRNSIDHGIEYPTIRASKNKSARGSVWIRIVPLAGSKVGIEVSDDGAGIDRAKIRKAAVEKGVITAKEEVKLTDDEALQLVFRSGLTTSPAITDLSGRGLGLSIVVDSVSHLGGDMTIASEVGKGTKITLRVPVRLATFRGVVVRLGGQEYIFPKQQVRKVIRVRSDEIVSRGNRSMFRHQGEMIEVIRLSGALGIVDNNPLPGKVHQVPIVIIAYGAGQIAFSVDQIIQVQEIVVRSLGSQLRHVKRIAGAMILGNGRVALVIDPLELIEEALTAGRPAVPEAPAGTAALRILIVEDSVTSRRFLQMILDRAGYQVQTAVDGIEALEHLKEYDFDLVVSDVDMPRMNGFLLTEKIRADTRLARLPIVLVTSLDLPEDQQHSVRVGADAYIIKNSFKKDLFLRVIHDLTSAI
jgi:two-component system chemotaxis sensor kinase CheA